MMVLAAICVMLIHAEGASAHGYIESPASRALLCHEGVNADCGQVQYEPQSVEGKGSFPQSGPADGEITGGGVFPELYEQTADRWHKVTIQGGEQTFTWHLTAPHATTEWKYYITKKDWNPNKPLTRDDLEPEPFCYDNDGGARPPTTVTHTCSVPTDRSGYHLILGVWEIADTGNAFYQVIDVNLVNDDSGGEAPAAPTNLVSLSQTSASIAFSWDAATAPNGVKAYEVYRDAQLIGTTSETTYTDTGLTPQTSYTYTVRTVDVAGNTSPFSQPLTVKTTADGSELPVWDPNTVYHGGDRVQHEGAIYEARWWTLGEEPGHADVWRKVE
ncbi:lytic polysaccharide monooxygenase [Brevibacillus humidisoli]|nr:lytic polysaccharide monooxygenase [Brevibacillus humidisoli]UFJ43309.1 lytic polysaccharide monooxygenase [Brevibacillus humidisoli]